MIDSLRKACRISCDILEKCIDNFKFKTEKDVFDFLVSESKKKNVGLAFDPVVVSKGNYLEIHHEANDTKLEGFVIIDFGIKVEEYCGDVTRMVYIGKPNDEEVEMYKLVLEVQEKAINSLKIGNDYCDLDLDSRKNFGKFKKYFEHTLGHGVGKKVHQEPWISFKSKNVVKKDDTITIEPGIYSKDFGIRIEDTILVLKNKVEVLTKMSNELVVIDS
jgi:Xaa-Pro aminopeptidase